jgi:hypothetical protein
VSGSIGVAGCLSLSAGLADGIVQAALSEI